jgi:hypothetical protein
LKGKLLEGKSFEGKLAAEDIENTIKTQNRMKITGRRNTSNVAIPTNILTGLERYISNTSYMFTRKRLTAWVSGGWRENCLRAV